MMNKNTSTAIGPTDSDRCAHCKESLFTFAPRTFCLLSRPGYALVEIVFRRACWEHRQIAACLLYAVLRERSRDYIPMAIYFPRVMPVWKEGRSLIAPALHCGSFSLRCSWLVLSNCSGS